MTKPIKFAVLVTHDKLYYVILNKSPDVIKEKAIRKAKRLNKIWTTSKRRND